jgi:AP-3 complex subunit beta
MLSSLLIGVLPEISGADVDLDQRGGVILRREQVKLVLFEGKGWTDLQVGTNKDHSKQPSVGSIGTLSSVIGKTMGGSVSLPEWLEQGVASTLRDSPFDAPAAPEVPTAISSSNVTRSNNASRVLTPVGSPMPPVPVGAPYLNLDEFYAEDETSDEEEEEEEEEDDDDDDDDDDDEEEEEEGEEGEEGKEEVVVEEEEGETGDDGEVEEEAESSDEDRDPMKRGELQGGGKSAQSS